MCMNICVNINVLSVLLIAVHEKLLRTSEDFVWLIDSIFHGRLILLVEFLDLKILPLDVRISSC